VTSALQAFELPAVNTLSRDAVIVAGVQPPTGVAQAMNESPSTDHLQALRRRHRNLVDGHAEELELELRELVLRSGPAAVMFGHTAVMVV
jgi:hypothetical protein